MKESKTSLIHERLMEEEVDDPTGDLARLKRNQARKAAGKPEMTERGEEVLTGRKPLIRQKKTPQGPRPRKRGRR